MVNKKHPGILAFREQVVKCNLVIRNKYSLLTDARGTFYTLTICETCSCTFIHINLHEVHSTTLAVAPATLMTRIRLFFQTDGKSTLFLSLCGAGGTASVLSG